MNKKLIVMLAAVATAGVMFARPGPGGFHGGPRGGHAPMRAPGFHHGHHHHHGGGWGVAGAVLGTAALVHDIVRPAPAVAVASPAPVVVTPAPVYTAAPVYAPPPPPPPPPVVHYHW